MSIDRISVTGAGGFLGRTLVDRALGRGFGVRAIMRHRPDDWPPKGVEVALVENYRSAPGPGTEREALVHLAEQSNLSKTVDEAGALAVARHLSRLGYAWLGYASTAQVYGTKSPVAHGVADPIVLETAYARSKFGCEAEVLNAHGTVFRLSNVYGNPLKPSTVLSDILNQIDTDGPIVVNDGTSIRDFCWSEDVADAILDLLARDCRGIYNVGAGRGLRIGDLASLALRIAGRVEGRVLSKTSRREAPSALVLDISKTTQDCGWLPATSIEAGLVRLLGRG